MFRLERWIRNTNDEYVYAIFEQAIKNYEKTTHPKIHTEKYLFVFRKRFLEKNTLNNIAKIMGVNQSCVGARASKSLRILRRELKNNYEFIHDKLFQKHIW